MAQIVQRLPAYFFCLRALSASLSARLPPPPRGKSDLTRASHSADGEISRNDVTMVCSLRVLCLLCLSLCFW